LLIKVKTKIEDTKDIAMILGYIFILFFFKNNILKF